MPTVHIHDLGTLRVGIDGVDCPIGGPKPRTILAVLTVQIGQSVSVPRLIDEVWGETAGDKTGRALESQIWRLRKALSASGAADEVLATDAAGYRLVAGHVECDSVSFTALAAEIDSAAARHDNARVDVLVEKALQLWDGEPYGGAARTPLVDAARTRLAELHRAVIGRRIDAWIAVGEGPRAVEAADQLIAQDAYDERWWVCKIRALATAGRTAAALATYGELRTLLADELGIDPGSEAQAAHRAVLVADSATTSIVRLPARFSSFVGRDDDVTRVVDMLGAGRLTTIVGPVGVGRSRLAIESARQSSPTPVDGIFFVSLTDVARPDVEAVIVSALRLTPSDSLDPRETLRGYIAGREMLLLLDDVDSGDHRDFVEEALSWTSHLTILATGATTLGIDGERILALDPLSVNPSGSSMPPAVRLLVDRIQASDNSFVPTDLNTLIEICAAVDGLPLGIELAAARALSFGIADIARQLGSELPTKIVDAIDAGYRQLPPDAASLHCALSVLPGPFTLDAAQGVWPHSDVAGTIDELVRHSLLTRYDIWPATGTRRFVQLRAVRQHASRTASPHDRAHDHRRQWIGRLLSARPRLGDNRQKDWIEALDADYSTVLAVLSEPEAFGGRELAQLTSYWFLRSRTLDGIAVLTAARNGAAARHGTAASSEIDRFALDLSLAATYAYAQRTVEARVLLEPWMPIDRERVGTEEEALVLECTVAMWVGDDHGCALALVEDVLAAPGIVDDASLRACAEAVLAICELTTGRLQDGTRRAHRALDSGLQNHNAVAAFLSATTLAIGALFDRDPRSGLMWSTQSIEHFWAMGGTQIGDHLEQRGMHHGVAEDWAAASTLFGAAHRMCTTAGLTWPRHPFTADVVDHCRTVLGHDFDARWQRGAALADRVGAESSPEALFVSGL